jgi:hypothetical protein
LVDRVRKEGFYAVTMTFPGWNNPADMFDFGLIHPLFPVNGYDCLCVHLQPSPISEAFTDAQQLAELTERCKSKVEHALLSSGSHKPRYSRVSGDDAWAECFELFRKTRLIRTLRSVLGSEKLTEAFVLLSSDGMPDSVFEDDVESCLFNLWLNLASNTPCAFRFKR